MYQKGYTKRKRERERERERESWTKEWRMTFRGRNMLTEIKT